MGIALAFLRANWLAAIFAALFIIQTVRIEGVGIWPLKIAGLQDKYDTAILKLAKARAELERISSRKNEQQVITVEKIKLVETIRREADKVAEKIEQAPLPGNCATPREILDADI